MNCKATKKLLSAFMESDVNEVERREVKDHLRSCVACASELEALKKTVTMIRWLPKLEAEPSFSSALMARLDEEPAAGPKWFEVWRQRLDTWRRAWVPDAGWTVPLAQAAVVLVLGLSLGIFGASRLGGNTAEVGAPLAEAPAAIQNTAEATPAPPAASSTNSAPEARPVMRRRSQPIAVQNVGQSARAPHVLGPMYGPPSIGKVEYVLEQLPPRTHARGGRQVLQNVHVQDGYITF